MLSRDLISVRVAKVCTLVVAVVCAVVFSGAAASAQTVVTWTGGGSDTSYNNPANWDLGVVPINDGTNSYKAVIGTGVIVNYDVPDGGGGNNTVTQFELGAGSTMTLQGRNLAVIDSAAVAGKIIATSGSFTAPHVSSTLSGSRSLLEVNTSANPPDSANITINASGTYFSTDANVKGSTILFANGSNATLDLPYLQTIDSYTDHYGTNSRTISATNNGAIDLSGVTLIRGGSGDYGGADILRILTTGGGTVDLSNLQQTEGYVTFETDVAGYTLPKLATASAVTYKPTTAGMSLNLPELVSQNGGGFISLPTGTIVSAPKLDALNNATLSFTGAGTFNAAALKNFAGSTLTLNDTTQAVTTGGLSQIDNARFLLSSGTTFNQISDTDYIITSSGIANTTVMSASGAGTSLDVHTLTKIDSYADHYGTNSRTISATNNGAIDLSGVTLIRGGSGDYGGKDSVRVVAETGGEIDLSSLTTVQGYTNFEAKSGGTLRFGDLVMTSSLDIKADGLNSKIAANSLTLDTSAVVSVTNGAEIELAGDFQNAITTAESFNMNAGILRIRGAGSAWLEAAGQDLGDTVTSGNFGMMQLVIGSETETETVYLTDIYDNDGMGQTAREALYLFGAGGIDGLEIYGGSTLVLGDVPVYAFLDGSMVELHSLFGPGDMVIPFTASGENYGFIAIPEPKTISLLIVGGLVILRRRFPRT